MGAGPILRKFDHYSLKGSTVKCQGRDCGGGDDDGSKHLTYNRRPEGCRDWSKPHMCVKYLVEPKSPAPDGCQSSSGSSVRGPKSPKGFLACAAFPSASAAANALPTRIPCRLQPASPHLEDSI